MNPVETGEVELKHIKLPGSRVCTGKHGLLPCSQVISGNRYFCLECSGNTQGSYSKNEVPNYV